MNLAINEHFTKIDKTTEKIVENIYINEPEKLLKFIIQRLIVNKQKADVLDGFIYQKLLKTHENIIKNELISYFPSGIILLQSCLKINYEPLQKLLMNEQFREADELTNKYLYELIKQKYPGVKRWLYFTDIQFLPPEDLFTLDFLWQIYSKGKFGFSIQKQIWIKSNENWDILWDKINWTKNGTMNRYPKEFQWTIEAPDGHLPLFNQLRGTQTLSYLFKNITWT
uniref:GUN4-like domain-containing protein n=1 Tax=Osmundea sinicola TaxID=290685 RepID=A0A7L4WP82_9FLOR|nr:hypothetical protein [Osmundea sinicola]QFR99806.1 hypothetical protein [Osmundea sinicola]